MYKALSNPYTFIIDPEITLEGFKAAVDNADWYYQRSDDYRKYQAGQAELYHLYQFAVAHLDERYLKYFNKIRNEKYKS